MKKKSIYIIILVLGIASVLSVVAFGKGEFNYNDVIKKVNAQKTQIETNENRSNNTSSESVASINGIEIYEEDIVLQIAKYKMQNGTVLDRDMAIRKAAKDKLVMGEAKKAGFNVSDSEFDVALANEYESFDKNLEVNTKFANDCDMTKDELVNVMAHTMIDAKIKGNYMAYVFTSLLSGEITSSNDEINCIMEKYKDAEYIMNNYDEYSKDFSSVIDLFTEDLMNHAEFVIYEDATSTDINKYEN